MLNLIAQQSVPTLILFAGVIDDVRAKKVHNWLFVTCSVVALIYSYWIGGFQGILIGLMGFSAAFLLTLPLVKIGALGGGDLKLLMAFGLATSWEEVLAVVIYSFIWGALFGLIRAALSGGLKQLLQNMINISTRKDVDESKLQKVPYTVALLLGWLTYLTSSAAGGFL